MKTNILFPALLLGVGLALGGSARADEVVKPTSAPAVSNASDHGASAEEPAIIDHVVYLAKLPSPDELVKGAELKGTPIVRMDQTSDRIVVVYQYGGGRTVTFAYTLLSTTASTQASMPVQSSNRDYQSVTPTSAPPPPPTVVYYSQPDVVYYSPSVRYYNPAWDFWTPLAVGIGLGWGFGGHGHGYGYGGWHGHGGWHH